MRDYDAANKADDDRNSKMSDLACQNDEMRKALFEIRELWLASTEKKPKTAYELYLLLMCRKMYRIAKKVYQQCS